MKEIESIFRYKKSVTAKLEHYGFAKEGGSFIYRTPICENQMRLTVKIDGGVHTEVYDVETEEPYTLYLIEDAEGEFVGRVRAEILRVAEDVAERCFDSEVFKGAHAAPVIEYAREKYGDELEFLWDDAPDCAVLRRKDTKKWYAVIMTVQYRKLGSDRDGIAEIIDMRMSPEKLDAIADGKTYFRGWHMNKKRWVTMLLYGSAPYEEMLRILDESYLLAVK